MARKPQVTEVDEDLVGDPAAHTSDGKSRPNSRGHESESSIDSSYRVTADELRQFVERVERVQAEKKDLSEQEKEIFSEAKARGYDTKVLRKVIAIRKRDSDDIAEEAAVLEMYCEALGM